MKKQLIALLLMLAIVVSAVSCGERIPAVDAGGPTPPTEDPGDVSDPDPDDGDGDAFTVTVMFGGSVYIPEKVADDSKALKVRFTDGKNYHTVNVAANGTASIKGLDGDYTVTLLNLPDGYTYNPNIYKISNDDKNITVELLKLAKTTGSGASSYQPIKITKTGVYRADIKREGQVIYFEFIPQRAGSYCVEALMDISAEMFNPMIDIYRGGSAGYNQFIERRDGGGIEGSYTKNFKYTIDVDKEFLGNGYVFGIYVEGKDAVYPTFVDFEVSYTGFYEYDWILSNFVEVAFIPNFKRPDGTEDYNKFSEWLTDYRSYLDQSLNIYGSSNYVDSAIRIDGKRVFDQSYYKLNPDDGYYHAYDEVKYAEYGGWGPILFAEITSENMFLADPDRETSFAGVEYNGNKALTVSSGTENYKLFIEGYSQLIISHGLPPNDSKPYLCNSDCPCYIAYKEGKPGNNGGSCSIEDNCQDCNEGCRHVPEALKFQRGYADIAYRDGRVPVTAELKDFLQKYSESQRLFSDGNGWVETYTPRYDAYEDSQWLFACGYYY